VTASYFEGAFSREQTVAEIRRLPVPQATADAAAAIVNRWSDFIVRAPAVASEGRWAVLVWREGDHVLELHVADTADVHVVTRNAEALAVAEAIKRQMRLSIDAEAARIREEARDQIERERIKRERGESRERTGPRPRTTRAEEIPCDWCGKMFAPRRPSSQHRFHSRDCYNAWRASAKTL
jgi:hypothetical protein